MSTLSTEAFAEIFLGKSQCLHMTYDYTSIMSDLITVDWLIVFMQMITFFSTRSNCAGGLL